MPALRLRRTGLSKWVYAPSCFPIHHEATVQTCKVRFFFAHLYAFENLGSMKTPTASSGNISLNTAP
jgi:hypothetical protein